MLACPIVFRLRWVGRLQGLAISFGFYLNLPYRGEMVLWYAMGNVYMSSSLPSPPHGHTRFSELDQSICHSHPLPITLDDTRMEGRL